MRNHGINEGYLVSGMLIPLIMPVDVLLDGCSSSCFPVIIGKEVFRGTGMNIVNIALTARAFLFFAYLNRCQVKFGYTTQQMLLQTDTLELLLW